MTGSSPTLAPSCVSPWELRARPAALTPAQSPCPQQTPSTGTEVRTSPGSLLLQASLKAAVSLRLSFSLRRVGRELPRVFKAKRHKPWGLVSQMSLQLQQTSGEAERTRPGCGPQGEAESQRGDCAGIWQQGLVPLMHIVLPAALGKKRPLALAPHHFFKK